MCASSNHKKTFGQAKASFHAEPAPVDKITVDVDQHAEKANSPNQISKRRITSILEHGLFRRGQALWCVLAHYQTREETTMASAMANLVAVNYQGGTLTRHLGRSMEELTYSAPVVHAGLKWQRGSPKGIAPSERDCYRMALHALAVPGHITNTRQSLGSPGGLLTCFIIWAQPSTRLTLIGSMHA